MKKELIKLGDKLFWDGKQDNVAVTVFDIPKLGNGVCIIDGNITRIVDACHLEPVSSNQKIEEVVESAVKVESPLPKIIQKYDEKINSLFIIIDEKTTICIPNVHPQIVNAIGISYKNDEDTYSEQIGNTLAFYRSKEKELKEMRKEINENPLAKLMGL